MAQNRISNLSDINSRKKPRVETAWIPMDGEIAAEYNELEAKVNRLRVQHRAATENAKSELTVRLAKAEDELKEAETQLRDVSVPFKFKSIGRESFDKLIQRCPPTPKQQEEAEKQQAGARLRWDPDKLFIELVPRSAYDPVITEAEAKEMQDDEKWNEAEIATLFNAALSANMTVHQVNMRNLGNGSRGTKGSA